jgi:hypothetical protein
MAPARLHESAEDPNAWLSSEMDDRVETFTEYGSPALHAIKDLLSDYQNSH